MNLPRLIHPVRSSTFSRRYGRNGKKRLHSAALLRGLENFTGSDCQRTITKNYKNEPTRNIFMPRPALVSIKIFTATRTGPVNRIFLTITGPEESRTPYPLLAKQMLYQMSYRPLSLISFHQWLTRASPINLHNFYKKLDRPQFLLRNNGGP